MTESMRSADLRRMLTARRQEVRDDVASRIRHRRRDQPNDGRDSIDVSDADIRGDIELALIQVRAATLARIDVALHRLDAGEYGSCLDCTREIAERRLRALPFAVRCQACEERREQAQDRAQRDAQRSVGFSLFPEFVTS